MGGKARNRHAHKADPGKTAVIGVKDRATGRVAAVPVHEVTTATATAMVAATTRPGADVFTDGSRVYDPLEAMGFRHARVIHSVGEYVRGHVSTNGVENYWSLLKRAYIGTFHYMSDDHLHRHTNRVRRPDTSRSRTFLARRSCTRWHLNPHCAQRSRLNVDSTLTTSAPGVSSTTSNTRTCAKCSRTAITSRAIGALLDR